MTASTPSTLRLIVFGSFMSPAMVSTPAIGTAGARRLRARTDFPLARSCEITCCPVFPFADVTRFNSAPREYHGGDGDVSMAVLRAAITRVGIFFVHRQTNHAGAASRVRASA